MKHRNILALCLGLFAAALLWQYYLWPKYQVRQETPEVMELIEQSAQKELEESVYSGEQGEVLFVGEPSHTELVNAPQKEENLVFYSQANKPKDIFELMSEDETKKHNPISIESDDFILDPSTVNLAQQQESEQQDDSRITMLTLPADFVVIKDSAAYNKFLSKNEGTYPKVNFEKDQIVVVLSASKLTDSFFEVVKIEKSDTDVKVFYRVNLISAGKDRPQQNYKVTGRTNLPVNFIQVK